MDVIPDLYLLRHGQTEWNLAGRLQGRQDSPLTPLGVVQAHRQRQLLRHLRGDLARYASPAGRAVQTAAIVFGDLDVQLDPRLQEIDIGAFTGQSEADLRRDHPAIFANGPLDWYDHAPDGEHFQGLEHRVRDFLSDLRQPAIIVTHGITLRMIWRLAMGLAPQDLGRLPLLQGVVHRVSAGAHRMFL